MKLRVSEDFRRRVRLYVESGHVLTLKDARCFYAQARRAAEAFG